MKVIWCYLLCREETKVQFPNKAVVKYWVITTCKHDDDALYRREWKWFEMNDRDAKANANKNEITT